MSVDILQGVAADGDLPPSGKLSPVLSPADPVMVSVLREGLLEVVVVRCSRGQVQLQSLDISQSTL